MTKCRCRQPKRHKDCMYCGYGYWGDIVCGVCKEQGIDGKVIRGTERRVCSIHRGEKMKEHKIKVLKDYAMCGGMVIPEGTILNLIVSEPSAEVYVDKKGNEFTFDTSEILFSGCFRNTDEEFKKKENDNL